MAYCAETREEARRVAEASFNWYLEETLRHFLGWAGGTGGLSSRANEAWVTG